AKQIIGDKRVLKIDYKKNRDLNNSVKFTTEKKTKNFKLSKIGFKTEITTRIKKTGKNSFLKPVL
ncbi:MAG: hypothetical protein WAX07_10955, partial [Candidatus Altiarchaeia archaeon]